MKTLIFAAGLGTRLKELTQSRPKALVEIEGRPLIQFVLDKVISEGATDIVVNVHHFADMLIDYIEQYSHLHHITIRISDERNLLLDTGGGLKRAFHLFPPTGEPILIHNVDILSNASLRHLHTQASNCDALLLVSQRETTRYLLFDEDMRLKGWTNVLTGEVRSPFPDLDASQCHRYAFSGIHVVSPRIHDIMATWSECFGIMDFYIQECSRLAIKGIIQPDLRLLDVGKPNAIAMAAEFIKEAE